MEEVYKSCIARFIATKGIDKYNTLYTKIAESNEFIKFCGLTVQKGLPPTAQDFIMSVATIWYVFRKIDQATNIMAALIELKLWNEKVNSKYNLISDYKLVIIATRIYEMDINLKRYDMGLLNFGNKALIKSTVYKISTGLAQIEQELQSSNQQVTPMVRGITLALKGEVKQLEALLKPNGQTDWNLINTLMVKIHDGKEIPLETFKSRLYNEALFLLEKTGIDIRIWL